MQYTNKPHSKNNSTNKLHEWLLQKTEWMKTNNKTERQYITNKCKI